MATLLSREQLSRDQLSREQLSRQQTASSTPRNLIPQGEADNTIMRIAHWNSTQQTRLLANLAAISQGNRGWILIANAPAPLSRRALIGAGVNPARVIEVKKASVQLLQQAMACTGIAALVCWQPAGTMLPTDKHRRQRVFMINQHDILPAVSAQARGTPGYFTTNKAGIARCTKSVAGEMAWRGLTRGYCGSIR